MKNFKFTIPTVAIAVLISICISSGILGIIVFQPERIINTTPNAPTSVLNNLDVLNDPDFATLSFNNIEINAEVARSAEKTTNGLMNRTSMPTNSGMLFIFSDNVPRTFWMKNTLIPLDIIFLDPNLKVVALHKSTKTNQTAEVYPSVLPAKYVLELNGGWSQNNDLQIGDTILIK